MAMKYSGSLCGGPEPSSMKACYGGCYEWCFHPMCHKAPQELTATERRRIRLWQRSVGGMFLTDLRRIEDFNLTPRMVEALKLTSPIFGATEMVTLPYRQTQALLRRDLIRESDGKYHISGAGARVLELIQPEQTNPDTMGATKE